MGPLMTPDALDLAGTHITGSPVPAHLNDAKNYERPPLPQVRVQFIPGEMMYLSTRRRWNWTRNQLASLSVRLALLLTWMPNFPPSGTSPPPGGRGMDAGKATMTRQEVAMAKGSSGGKGSGTSSGKGSVMTRGAASRVQSAGARHPSSPTSASGFRLGRSQPPPGNASGSQEGHDGQREERLAPTRRRSLAAGRRTGVSAGRVPHSSADRPPDRDDPDLPERRPLQAPRHPGQPGDSAGIIRRRNHRRIG
jgi:hypothetical protein